MGYQPKDAPPLANFPSGAADLRAQADAMIASARARGAELLEQAQEEAEKLRSAADVLDRLASGEHAIPLHARIQATDRDNVRAMDNAHKLKIGAKHAKSKLSVTVQATGYSLNDFGRLPHVDVPATTLASAHSGARPIAEEKCIRVRNALGKDDKGEWRFPATLENWPRMIPSKKK